MNPSANIESLITQHGGKLVRSRKHQVYKFEDGRVFTLASTPSDWRAELNILSDLKRFLGLSKQEATVGERREKKIRKHPTRVPLPEIEYSTNQSIQPLDGANGTTQMRELPPLPAMSYLPGAPSPTYTSGTIVGKVAVTMRRPQEYHEPATVIRFSQEVIQHCNFLARTQGPKAVEVYLKGAKQMSTHHDLVNEATRIREGREQSATGPIETALREAQQKAEGFRTEASRLEAEAQKWEGVAASLQTAYELTNAPAEIASKKTNGHVRRGAGEGVGHGGWVAKIKDAMADGIPKTLPEIRKILGTGLPKESSPRIYAAVNKLSKDGRLAPQSDGKYTWNEAAAN